ncbi:MAG: Ppx/GppA phosphatase family protein [Actinomycetota bacterium]
MSDVHAAIDIGTNSVHLVVARALPGGGFDVVTTEKNSVRLGSGGGDMKVLAPDAMDRGVAALAHMLDVATSLGAEVTAVATSAVREAENQAEFVDRVQSELGLTIDVIAGQEEARLIHRGVVHAVPVGDSRALIVDIGGGSTEFIITEGPELLEARSLRLGAIRLTQRFFGKLGPNDVPGGKAINACRRYLRTALSGVARDLGGHQPQLLIGSSGTMEAVAEMVAARRGEEPSTLNGFRFTADEVAEVVEVVFSMASAERNTIRGLDEKRYDIICGGILLISETMAAFGMEEIVISEFALREGVLFDRFPADTGHLRDLRRSNALRLAQQLDPDVAHAETCARLALQLFDRTAEVHGLDAEARQVLEMAALVHNVGMVIAHSGHHKHTYYVVRHSEQLTGFTARELELIALVARYHRKSHPSDKHPEFAALDDDERRLVRILAGLLRLAIGLDRRHSGRVKGVTVRIDDDATESGDGGGNGKGNGGPIGRLIVEPVANGEDVAVEVSAATDRSRLASTALGVQIVIQERAPVDPDVVSS